MSLQFIIGSSGSGKSCYAYQNIIEQAGLHPDRLYYVIVPEQFTMQTQKTLVEMSPGKGILNIDILSFERLAYRVLEEVGGDSRTLLEETGKSMVLQKMVQQHGKELSYLGGQMRKAGYLDEVKSILSEFMQYDIKDSDIEEMIEDSADRTLLQMKLKDVSVLYQAFTGYLKDHYMTGEEVMDALEKALPFSEKMKSSVLLLDGYTGFTPIQMRVVGELLSVCEKVMVTVTMDAAENLAMRGKPYQLFYMSRQMIHGLSELTRDIEDPVLLNNVKRSRFAQAPALNFLEKNIFRYRKNVKELPGKPDIVLYKYRTVIFINGCFWHHHYGWKYGRYPQSRTEYWIKHINRNVDNDVKNYNLLQQLDYKVIVVWECEIREDFEHRMKLLIEEITQ